MAAGWNRMRLGRVLGGALVLGGAGLIAFAAIEYKSGKVWPEPKIIDPGPPGGPPSDAIVLFDGKDLSQWEGGEKWEVADGAATVRKAVDLDRSNRSAIANCTSNGPRRPKSKAPARDAATAAVFLQSRYEVQVLDSYDNVTYFDGQAARSTSNARRW